MTLMVWKFPFDVADEFSIVMPDDAQVLAVDVQHGQPCLWALVNPNAEKVPRRFRLAGTGHPLPKSISKCSFVGTFQMLNGSLVFHLWSCP